MNSLHKIKALERQILIKEDHNDIITLQVKVLVSNRKAFQRKNILIKMSPTDFLLQMVEVNNTMVTIIQSGIKIGNLMLNLKRMLFQDKVEQLKEVRSY